MALNDNIFKNNKRKIYRLYNNGEFYVNHDIEVILVYATIAKIRFFTTQNYPHLLTIIKCSDFGYCDIEGFNQFKMMHKYDAITINKVYNAIMYDNRRFHNENKLFYVTNNSSIDLNSPHLNIVFIKNLSSNITVNLFSNNPAKTLVIKDNSPFSSNIIIGSYNKVISLPYENWFFIYDGGFLYEI